MKDRDDLDFDLFGPVPKEKMSDEEITRKLCPRCWKQISIKKVEGLEWCSYCNSAIVYLKHRPFSNRNDP